MLTCCCYILSIVVAIVIASCVPVSSGGGCGRGGSDGSKHVQCVVSYIVHDRRTIHLPTDKKWFGVVEIILSVELGIA